MILNLKNFNGFTVNGNTCFPTWCSTIICTCKIKTWEITRTTCSNNSIESIVFICKCSISILISLKIKKRKNKNILCSTGILPHKIHSERFNRVLRINCPKKTSRLVKLFLLPNQKCFFSFYSRKGLFRFVLRL